MRVQRNTIIGDPVLRWLLVIAFVFAPLQGAVSAFGHDCHADYAMTTVEEPGNNTLAAVDTDTTEEKCFCDHCEDMPVCDSACNAVHISAFLINFSPLVVSEPRLPPQAQVLEQLFSYFVSPLLHPPQI